MCMRIMTACRHPQLPTVCAVMVSAACRAVCLRVPCLLQEEMSPEKVMMEAIKGKGHYDSWRVVD